MMVRKVIEYLYAATAMHMPLYWQWQWNYCMSARFYFEYRNADDFVGWPWKWRLKRFETINHKDTEAVAG